MKDIQTRKNKVKMFSGALGDNQWKETLKQD